RLAILKDSAQIGVIEVRKVFGVKFPPRRVVSGERFAKLAGFGNTAPASHQWRTARDLVHQEVDEFQFIERLPAVVPLPPLIRRSPQPDRERLGEILVRMRLRIPVRQMTNEAPA